MFHIFAYNANYFRKLYSNFFCEFYQDFSIFNHKIQNIVFIRKKKELPNVE